MLLNTSTARACLNSQVSAAFASSGEANRIWMSSSTQVGRSAMTTTDTFSVGDLHTTGSC